MLHLLNEGDDVMVVSGSSCLTAAHLASLTSGTNSTIYMTGVQSEAHVKQVNLKLQSLNANRILLIYYGTVNFP